MKTPLVSAGPFRQSLSLILAASLATGPSTAALAQTNAAAQAVRQRVQGLDSSGEREPSAPRPEEAPTADAPTAEGSVGQADLSYVPGDAAYIAILRPAQLLASPLAKLLPVELASAYGLKYAGFDPNDVDEVVAFAQAPTKGGSYGLIAKFKEPFKGSAIPTSLRGAAKVGELGGRKYLQSSTPTGLSFYGPDAKTLVVAPDAVVRQLVETKDQPKSGPLVDRILAAPIDSDLYVGIDFAGLGEWLAVVTPMYAAQLPPEAQQFLEAPNLITAAEFTFNASAPDPMTLVVHANDEASAEQLESLVQNGMKMYQSKLQAQSAATAAGEEPLAAAMARYNERVSGEWAPVREGDKLTFFRTDGKDARERQLVQAAILGFVIGKLMPRDEETHAAPGDDPTVLEEEQPSFGEQK